MCLFSCHMCHMCDSTWTFQILCFMKPSKNRADPACPPQLARATEPGGKAPTSENLRPPRSVRPPVRLRWFQREQAQALTRHKGDKQAPYPK